MDQDSDNQNTAATQNTEPINPGTTGIEPTQPVNSPETVVPEVTPEVASEAAPTSLPSPSPSVASSTAPAPTAAPTSSAASISVADTSAEMVSDNGSIDDGPANESLASEAPAKEPSPEVQAAAAELAQSAAPEPTAISSSTKLAKPSKKSTTSSEPATSPTKTQSGPKSRSTNANNASKETTTAPTKKKPKTGQTIAIVISCLLLLGIVGALIYFFVYYNNPEKVAFDAINGAFSAENIALDGEVIIAKDNNNDDSTINRVALHFTSASAKTPTAGTLDLAVDLKDDPDFSAQFEYVQMEDGILYLKVDGIMEMMKSVTDKESSKDLEKQLSTTFELIEDIDGEWWEVSVVDVMKSLETDRSAAELTDKVYACAIDVGQSDYMKELAGIYKEHRFVEVEKINSVDTDGHWFTYDPTFGNSLYEVNLNKRELANFITALPETKAAENFIDCYNSAMKEYFKDQGYSSRVYGDMLLDADDIDEVTAYDIDIPEEAKFYLEISNWNHTLKRFIVTNFSKDIYHASASVGVNYSKPSINAPSSYKPLTDLIDDKRVDEAYNELWAVQYDDSFYDDDLYYDDDFTVDEFINLGEEGNL